MLDSNTRYSLVGEASAAAYLAAEADFTAGRRADTLTSAHLSVILDLARLAGGRSAFEQWVAPRDLEQAAVTFRRAFGCAYVLHLANFGAERQRDMQVIGNEVALVNDLLAALDATMPVTSSAT